MLRLERARELEGVEATHVFEKKETRDVADGPGVERKRPTRLSVNERRRGGE
jgi:hypothetical protein